jgi:acyl-CoA thioesterase-2
VKPDVPPPEAVPEVELLPELLARMPESLRQFYLRARPFESRMVRTDVASRPATQCLWIRAVDRLPDDDALHRCLLAYASDFYLMPTATLAHPLDYPRQQFLMASIDHAMWFHQPVRVDEWLLCVTDSPSASGARGFTRGSIYTRSGRLVASMAQEGLMRVVAGSA